MSLPPWYRPKTRPLAEAVLTLDLSRTTGIGPLEAGLSTMWDMTPALCAPDPSYCVRLTVDPDAKTLRVTRRSEQLATLYLEHDATRIGKPLRAICQSCERRCHRLFLGGDNFSCGVCLRVTYSSGQYDERDRVLSRTQRLEYRLVCTNFLPRHRGRRIILADLHRQNERLLSTFPVRLQRLLLLQRTVRNASSLG